MIHVKGNLVQVQDIHVGEQGELQDAVHHDDGVVVAIIVVTITTATKTVTVKVHVVRMNNQGE